MTALIVLDEVGNWELMTWRTLHASLPVVRKTVAPKCPMQYSKAQDKSKLRASSAILVGEVNCPIEHAETDYRYEEKKRRKKNLTMAH